MHFIIKHPIISLAALAATVAASAQVTTIPYTGTTGGAWSNSANWTAGNVPNTNAKQAQFSGTTQATIDVDANFTINSFIDGFSAGGVTLGGNGTLTIDRNTTSTAVGIDNATGNTGAAMRLAGNVTISNSASTGANGITTIRNANSAANALIFEPTSVLTITTPLQTVQGVGGSIQFNGKLASSGSNLQVNSSNVSFGVGHDSADFGRDIVLFTNSKIAVDGGTVLNTGRKFQVNGANAELELNAANAINGANIVVGGTNNFLLDVNANQIHMGTLTITDGVFTIDVAPNVTFLAFSASDLLAWGTGTVNIIGFQENVIRFGEDATGLTPAQLAVINGGIYSLNNAGYLTAVPIPEPATCALLLGGLALGGLAVRRKRRSQS